MKTEDGPPISSGFAYRLHLDSMQYCETSRRERDLERVDSISLDFLLYGWGHAGRNENEILMSRLLLSVVLCRWFCDLVGMS
jgi:hypothetical protein